MKDPTDNTSSSLSRRNFLKSGLAVGAAGAIAAGTTSTLGASTKLSSIQLNKGDVILFQGDSITDAGRKKDNKSPNDSGALGKGYAAMIAGDLLAEYPDLNLQFYNRGISGNKVPDLAGRWQEDTIDLKPAVLSILVGINDLWHTIAFGSKYKGTIKDYEEGYRELIEQSLAEIPDVKIVICEPFELRNWADFDKYREVAQKLADEKGLIYVQFHSIFKKVADAEGTDGKFWAWDGIHPTISGHSLMRGAWREAVGV